MGMGFKAGRERERGSVGGEESRNKESDTADIIKMLRLLGRAGPSGLVRAAAQRGFNSGPATTHGSEESVSTGGTKGHQKTLFSDDSNWFLITKYLTYQACRSPFIVKNSRKMTDIAYKILRTDC